MLIREEVQKVLPLYTHTAASLYNSTTMMKKNPDLVVHFAISA